MHSRRVLTAARLLAPVLDPGDPAAGFDWCAVRLTAAGCAELAYEVELAKASSLLASGQAKEAIGVYRVCTVETWRRRNNMHCRSLSTGKRG